MGGGIIFCKNRLRDCLVQSNNERIRSLPFSSAPIPSPVLETSMDWTAPSLTPEEEFWPKKSKAARIDWDETV